MIRAFTSRAVRIVLVEAQKEARRAGSDCLEPEYILIPLLLEPDSTAVKLLRFLRIDCHNFVEALEKEVAFSRQTGNFNTEWIQISPEDLQPSTRCKLFLQNAAEEAGILGHELCGTEHLLLAALREENSAASNYLKSKSVNLDMLRIIIKTTFNREAGYGSSDYSSNRQAFVPFFQTAKTDKTKIRSALENFTTDLTELAYKGKLDPVIGRSKEIERAVRILARRTKNNPVLIGEPGVGKTAIAEGVAQFIVSRAAPESLAKKKLLSLNMGQLIAGTKYRGEFEERVNRLLKEICGGGNVILFIDEIHTLIGAGNASGALDAANMLKPALSRGSENGGFQCIGATTLSEYKKYFEKDGALERRFQKILVEEPDGETAAAILEGLKRHYEDYHRVTYTEGAIRETIRLSKKFIHGRQLPDKAIDVLDETGAAKKLHAEKQRPSEITKIEKEVEKLVAEKDLIFQNKDSNGMPELFLRAKELRSSLIKARDSWEKLLKNEPPLVTEQDIAAMVSEITGIPLAALEKSEARRLLSLENELGRHIAGQDAAISALCAALRRARIGLARGKKPIGSFLFTGPAGTGKSYTAKTLALALFGSEDAVLRVDMSDYMEKHNASRLAGAPPGYMGFEEGGVLTEEVKRRPYRVILFDEIEKAHRSVLDMLLQVLEEGALYDNFGRRVDFSNTVIIMTSNAGSDKLFSGSKLGFGSFELEKTGGTNYEALKTEALSECKKVFSAEFISRIDEIVVFTPLSDESLRKILARDIEELQKTLSERNVSFEISDSAVNFILNSVVEAKKGARGIKRAVQREIEEPLSVFLLENNDNGRLEALSADFDAGKNCVKISAPYNFEKSAALS